MTPSTPYSSGEGWTVHGPCKITGPDGRRLTVTNGAIHTIPVVSPGLAVGGRGARPQETVVPTEGHDAAVVGSTLSSGRGCIDPPESADLGANDGTCARGRVTWLSSGEDEGPDCGLVVGLGNGKAPFIGELADQTVRDSGIEPGDFDGIGWWVAIEDGDHLQVVAAVADQEAARSLHDAVAGSLAATRPAEQVGTEPQSGAVHQDLTAQQEQGR